MYHAGRPLAEMSAWREETAEGLYRIEVTEAGMPVRSEAMLAGGWSSAEREEMRERTEERDGLGEVLIRFSP